MLTCAIIPDIKRKKIKDKIATLNGMFLIIFSVLGFIAILAGLVIVTNVEVILGIN